MSCLYVLITGRLLSTLVAVLVYLAFGQAVNQFQLVGLVAEQLAGFVGADLAVDERMVGAE